MPFFLDTLFNNKISIVKKNMISIYHCFIISLFAHPHGSEGFAGEGLSSEGLAIHKTH